MAFSRSDLYSRPRYDQHGREIPSEWPGDGPSRPLGISLEPRLPSHSYGSYLSDSPHSSASSSSNSQESPLTLNPRDLENNDSNVLESFLRNQIHIPPNMPVSLQSVPNPPNGERPTQKLQDLVELAIFDSPNKRLALQEIYEALGRQFTWYRNHMSEDNKWKGSIRHLLSLQGIFRSERRPISEPGKGNYWSLDISTNPTGTKRARKR
ncbi:hypothetical protein C8J56DRAFT_797389, partial [Mycena floridula]